MLFLAFLLACFRIQNERRRADMYEKLYFDAFPQLRVLKYQIERGEQPSNTA